MYLKLHRLPFQLTLTGALSFSFFAKLGVPIIIAHICVPCSSLQALTLDKRLSMLTSFGTSATVMGNCCVAGVQPNHSHHASPQLQQLHQLLWHGLGWLCERCPEHRYQLSQWNSCLQLLQQVPGVCALQWACQRHA